MLKAHSLFTQVFSHSLSPLAVCVSDEKTLYLTPEQEKDKSHFTDKEVNPCSLSLGVIHTVAWTTLSVPELIWVVQFVDYL